jgi:hypothetical protein
MLRETEFYKMLEKNKDTYMAVSVAEGFADFEPTQEQMLAGWQFLHDTGIAYTLQGFFGRTAQALLEQGLIEE